MEKTLIEQLYEERPYSAIINIYCEDEQPESAKKSKIINIEIKYKNKLIDILKGEFCNIELANYGALHDIVQELTMQNKIFSKAIYRMVCIHYKKPEGQCLQYII